MQTKWGRLALCLLLVPTLLLGQRRYWPVSVDSLATGRVIHTHVQVTGRVTLVRWEADGDLHIKLVGRRGFVLCECIPSLPCRVPTVGERITVRGISRRDLAHGWQELHPVEWLSP